MAKRVDTPTKGGPGNLHLIDGLYDCCCSRLLVLVIAAQIPSGYIGTLYSLPQRGLSKVFVHQTAQCDNSTPESVIVFKQAGNSFFRYSGRPGPTLSESDGAAC